MQVIKTWGPILIAGFTTISTYIQYVEKIDAKEESKNYQDSLKVLYKEQHLQNEKLISLIASFRITDSLQRTIGADSIPDQDL